MSANQEWNTSWESGSSSANKLTLATFQHRLGAYALDWALCFCTLGIGWMIWSLVTWGKGQTPAKQILKIRVYAETSRTPATWGHMAVREFLTPLAIGMAGFVLNAITLGIIGSLGYIAWIVLEIVWYFTKGQRTLRDYFVKTLVVNEAA